VLNGAVIGFVMQILGLYGGRGLELVSTGLGIFLLCFGIIMRMIPPKPLPPEPPVSDQRAFKRYKTTVANRKFWANIDFVAWGGIAVIVEAVVLTISALFGWHFPVASS
jgi:hypothetical protein